MVRLVVIAISFPYEYVVVVVVAVVGDDGVICHAVVAELACVLQIASDVAEVLLGFGAVLGDIDSYLVIEAINTIYVSMVMLSELAVSTRCQLKSLSDRWLMTDLVRVFNRWSGALGLFTIPSDLERLLLASRSARSTQL